MPNYKRSTQHLARRQARIRGRRAATSITLANNSRPEGLTLLKEASAHGAALFASYSERRDDLNFLPDEPVLIDTHYEQQINHALITCGRSLAR